MIKFFFAEMRCGVVRCGRANVRAGAIVVNVSCQRCVVLLQLRLLRSSKVHPRSTVLAQETGVNVTSLVGIDGERRPLDISMR